MRDALTNDEMPPEWMWPLDHEMVIWLERVTEERKEKYGGSDRDDRDSHTTVPMMQNEYARGRR